MSDTDITSIVAQFEHLNAKHKTTSYITAGAIILVLGFAAIGMWMMFSKFQDQAALNEKLVANQAQFAKLAEEIKAQNIEQKKFYDTIADLQKDMAEIKTDYAILRASVNRPLPQTQQDPFFLTRGYAPSYYQQDGGRLFGPAATVKLQTTIVDNEECKEVVVNQDKQLGEKGKLILSLEDQKTKYVQSIELKEADFKIVDTELKKTQKELRRAKVKKILWTTLGTSLGLYAGYELAK